MLLKEWLSELNYTRLQGSLDVEVEEVVFDSRKAAPGAVFVCIAGTKTDSHTFIPQVLSAGVKVLVVEKPVFVPSDVTVILAEQGREALALLSAARFGYPARELLMIGITGTKGKTTTAHMVRALLEAAGRKTGIIGTNGVGIGEQHYDTVNTTPESYELHRYFREMAEAGCECCVMEVSSQALKMCRVAGIVYDYAIFTNLSKDHIGENEHKDFEEYLFYKKQIFRQSRLGLVNVDDSHLEQITEGIPCQWDGYGFDHKARYQAKEIHFVSEPDFVGLEFEIRIREDERWNQIPVRVNIPGRFNVNNALAAAAVCLKAGVSKEVVCHGLEHLKLDGRMEIVYSSKRCCVIVDYAHNEVSMESLLSALREYQPKRLVCVFGCGGNRSKDRRYSMGEIAGRMADLSIITADNSRYEKVEDIMADIRGSIEKTGGAFVEIPDRREAIAYSITHAQEGDMIAVIGKGHENYQEVEGVRYPFLDREVIQEVVDLMEETV
ncbi:UDP-N-acetylmuramoyl-L-alanyl-D-glutamate--2,6-diaminopimelate ligase [bacterium D16-54]|nr:UDP-N-acetylmuramoyl-L-alanyl-D-glutamate--2,6-diaminopimelate ligase [bacterium D16-54]RKJ13503.1 UDP-N-acetylmuramoyl-L-alanyl-D-glutamate--2,6-diaminopimelate ligase [bacterium D16-56]